MVAGDFRRTVHKKLIALEEREVAAHRRAEAARVRMSCISGDLEAASAEVARLLAINQRLKGVGKSEEDWSKKGRHSALKSASLGPVTLEVCAASHARGPGMDGSCIAENVCGARSDSLIFHADGKGLGSGISSCSGDEKVHP